MRTHDLTRDDAKAMARALKTRLAARGIEIAHGQALDIVAGQLGHEDWNVLSARLPEADDGAGKQAGDGIVFTETCPIMRIFDEDRAREFYVGFLGFTLDWEHRFGANFPLYMQVSRAGLILHLSGHHGDATPGSTVFVAMSGVRAYQRELIGRNYTNMKPGVQDAPWGAEMEVIDPFGNRIRFCERPAG